MKNISKAAISQNLKTLNTLYNSSRNNSEAIFYSKLAVLELCGWIEEAMEKIILSCVIRTTKNITNRDTIKKTVIKRNRGFDYEDHLQNMLIHVVGFRDAKAVESAVTPATITILKSKTASLKTIRNVLAHTYSNDTTTALDAPSITIHNFCSVFKALSEFQDVMKKKGF